MRRRLALLLAVAALALGAGCGEDEPPDWLVERATPTSTTTAPTSSTVPTSTIPGPGRQVPAVDLVVGTCLVDIGAFIGEAGDAITEASTVPCREPHRGEVYARGDLAGRPNAPFPGAEALQEQAQTLCQDRFRGFVGVPWTASALDIAALWPSRATWDEGDRLVVCALFRLDGEQLTGTSRGARL